MAREIPIDVNGTKRMTVTDDDRSLLDVLREDLQLTGTKYGCGEGECGACTVLVDGQPTRSCITTIADVEGQQIQTIEGLAKDQLHGVQQAFLAKQAMQCGYCVPGQIMTAVAFVRENSNASNSDIIAAMDEHICRCCNYPNILAAVKEAVNRSR